MKRRVLFRNFLSTLIGLMGAKASATSAPENPKQSGSQQPELGEFQKNLASDAGADLIGITSPHAPAFLKTLSDIVNGSEVSIFQAIPRSEYEAIKNFTSNYDCSPAFIELLNQMRDTRKFRGGKILMPFGLFNIDSTINFYMPGVQGLAFQGGGATVTAIRWRGGATTAFTNATDESERFQYGVNFNGFTLGTTIPGSKDLRLIEGSTGIHLEMCQKHWATNDISIYGFDTNLDIGIHAEAGGVNDSQFSYGRVNVNMYGNQADCTVFNNVWNYGAKERGYLISSPRCQIVGGFIGSVRGYSNPKEYVGIQIGFQAARSTDIGKTRTISDLKAGGNGNRCLISQVAFEGDGEQAHILVKNIDEDPRRPSGLWIINNNFAAYNRNSVIEFATPYDNATISGNFLSKSKENNTGTAMAKPTASFRMHAMRQH